MHLWAPVQDTTLNRKVLFFGNLDWIYKLAKSNNCSSLSFGLPIGILSTKSCGYSTYILFNHTATILTPIHWSTDYFLIVLLD